MGEPAHPSGTGASSDPGMEPRVPAGSGRDQHAPTRAPICHCSPELQSQAGAGLLSRDAPAAPELPAGGVWEGTGAGGTHRGGRGKNEPQGHLSTPHPLQEPEAIALKGTLCRSPDSGAVSHPTGQDRVPGRGALAERRELWKGRDLGTGVGGGRRGGERGERRRLGRRRAERSIPGPVPPPVPETHPRRRGARGAPPP